MHFIAFSKTPSPFAALLSFLRFIFAYASAFCPGKKMGWTVLFLSLLCWVSSANEVDYRSLQSHSIFSVVPRHHPKLYPSVTSRSPTQVRSLPTNPTVSPSEPLKIWTTMPSTGPAPVLALSPKYHGYAPSPSKVRSKHHLKHHLKRHHLGKHPAVSPFPPSLSPAQGCDLTCSDPRTSTPVGSPCGCVVPMQVVLVLGVAPITVFPHTPELEAEIAAGTCLKQSQVRILGADAGGQDQEKTRVDINLVPLSKKFNKTTALLTFERFWQKKVPISRTLFGDYEVISVRYPGLPSSPQLPSGISPTSGNQDPIVANVTSNGQKFTARTITVIVLSSSVVFLTGTGVLVIFLKCKKAGSVPADGPPPTSSISERSSKGMRSGLSSSMSTPKSASLISPKDTSGKIFSLAELEKATGNFSSKRLLGVGGFGCVYLGTMEDGSEVAVKRLIMVDQGRDREFIAEVEMLSRLHHRNLVKLVGICIEKGTRCLVYELVHNGSVESHLHGSDQRRIPLDWDARMKIALGAARGLAYLHEDSNPRVIHRDFKAANILLEDDFTPKVSDFGLAREASEGSQQISTQVMGTFGYVAPEYAMTGHLLVKSDVYSYGVVLLELLSGRKAIDMSCPQGHESLVTWAQPLLTSREGLEKVVDPSLGGNYDFNDLAKVASIASMCIQPEVMKRPFMGEIVQALMLVYTDKDETYEDSYGLREDSSGSDVDFTGDGGPESWRRGRTPCLTHGISSSFITMEYSSGPLEIMDRPLSTSVLVGEGGSLTGYNRSGPLRTKRDKLKFYRLKRSISENGLLVKQIGNNGYMF